VKLLYVVNEAQFFISHRLPLGLEAQAQGHEVIVVSAGDTGESQLAEYGFRHLSIPMSRSDFKLSDEIKTFRALRRIYVQERPDLVHHVTIKPVVYGTFAARSSGVPAVVNAVPGMGFVFTRRGRLAAVRRAFVNMLYRLAMSHKNMRVIFQNTEDLRGFVGHAIVKKEQVVLIRGSGVDLEKFPTAEPPNTPITFVLPSRMLRDKGVREFAEAAAEVAKSHPDWQFWLLGGVDPGNPSAFATAELVDIEREFGVTWLGHRDDVAHILQQSHVVCLPSYREGVPKVLLEASAIGRPMIASNIAGCREVVTEGVTGLLVEPRDSEGLARAMQLLGEDDELRARCSRAARERAEAVFAVADVVDHTFRVYAELLNT
jgi:glycosyltransferase involved in cell wall biosynthesis